MLKKKIVVTKVNHCTDATLQLDPNHVLIYSWNFINPLIAKPTKLFECVGPFCETGA